MLRKVSQRPERVMGQEKAQHHQELDSIILRKLCAMNSTLVYCQEAKKYLNTANISSDRLPRWIYSYYRCKHSGIRFTSFVKADWSSQFDPLGTGDKIMLLSLSVTCITTNGVPKSGIPAELASMMATRAFITPLQLTAIDRMSLVMPEIISLSAR